MPTRATGASRCQRTAKNLHICSSLPTFSTFKNKNKRGGVSKLFNILTRLPRIGYSSQTLAWTWENKEHSTCLRAIQARMMKGLTESLLLQPPSFVKKKSYDVHQVLGTGSFGKVVVRPLIYLKWSNSFDWPYHPSSCFSSGFAFFL